MANTIPELTKVGVVKETTWGTYPGSAPILIPVEPPDINEEIEHIVDENSRGVQAMDFEAYAGMRKVTGTLRGLFYGASDATEAAVASPTAHVLRAFFGGDTSVQIGTTTSYIHEFFAANDPGSLSIQIEDAITSIAGTTDNLGAPTHVGCMVPSLTIGFDANDGMMSFEAEVLGVRTLYLHSTTTPAGVAIAADKTGEAFVGWGASIHYGAAAANPVAINGKLLSAEINLEREITTKVGTANINYANIRAARPPRVTFTATLELQDDYDDVHKYSLDNDTSDYTTHTDFTDNQDAWTFRFSNNKAITTATADATIDTTLTDDVESVFDIRLHKVSYGEGVLTISRDEVSNTIEINGRALYVASPTWFGATPNAASQAGQRLVQMRLINNKTAAY